MARVKDNVICLFGGIKSDEEELQKPGMAQYLSDFYFLNLSNCIEDILNLLDEAYWSTPSSGGYAPTARKGFTMSSNSVEVGSEVIIFGGKNIKDRAEQFMYVLTE